MTTFKYYFINQKIMYQMRKSEAKYGSDSFRSEYGSF